MKKEYELQNGKTVVFEYDENKIGKVTVEAMDCLIDMLPKWIPCSERLPEEDEFVLVTYCWFRRKDDLAVNIDHIKDGAWAISESVVAWMPLPDPYKGE